MDQRKKIKKTKYLTVFALTTLIFIIGLIVGYEISSAKMDTLTDLEQSLRIDTLSMEVQYQLLSQNPCEVLDSATLSEELYSLGSKLSFMEERMGSDDPTVIRLKNYYYILEARHLLFLQKTKEECGRDLNLIVYFYSNQGDCPRCEEQGYALTYLRKEDPSVRVYTFDIDQDNMVVDTLKELFVKNRVLPVLVINGETYYGYLDKNAIIKLLDGADEGQ